MGLSGRRGARRIPRPEKLPGCPALPVRNQQVTQPSFDEMLKQGYLFNREYRSMEKRVQWPNDAASDAQLELGLGHAQERAARGSSVPLSGARRQRRACRARWWFERMRQVADRAFDWQSAPPARPVQRWLPNSDEPD